MGSMGKCKHKRGDGGSTEDEVNSAKKPNMEATDCTNNDSEAEELEGYFYETVSEQEPSLKDIKVCFQVSKPRSRIYMSKEERWQKKWFY